MDIPSFSNIILIIALLGFLYAVINQYHTVFLYLKSLSTESYEIILNKSFGENYNIPINEGTSNFLSFFVYLWISFFVLLGSAILVPFSKPPINYLFYTLYFVFAFLSSNLLACARIKKIIENLELENNLSVKKKYLINKYITWSSIPFIFYVIMFFVVYLLWFSNEFIINT
jgi:hypothetical protein